MWTGRWMIKFKLLYILLSKTDSKFTNGVKTFVQEFILLFMSSFIKVALI